MVKQVKDMVLSLLWLRLLLWHRFDPWPRNFHMPGELPKKTKKKKQKKQKTHTHTQIHIYIKKYMYIFYIYIYIYL